MRLALNTLIYEAAGEPLEASLEGASRMGFRHVEVAAFGSADPRELAGVRRGDVLERVRGLGLTVSQLLAVGSRDYAASEGRRREAALDYLKRCGEWQLELGGRQVLVCWGAGLHESGMTRARAWLNSMDTLRRFAEWALPSGLLVGIELDPHVYFVINDTTGMCRALEEVGLPNVYPNVDVGHLTITREGPETLEKWKHRLLHVHLSETESFAHTNSILGRGFVDFAAYIRKLQELGIEENCRRVGEACVAGIEMGPESGTAHCQTVKDPDSWVRESLVHLGKVLPELTL